jgi:small G protein signaling modulator 3
MVPTVTCPSNLHTRYVQWKDTQAYGTVTSQIITTKWHTYSDEAIQTAISKFSASESPADAPDYPYHTTLRILSSAVHNLSRVRLELEDTRKVLYEKELARRKRAD